MNKQISRVWSFASDSNPNIEYETLQYMEGSTSRNCKGWTRRMAADLSRSCKPNRFGFNITWGSGRGVVVEAVTNLANPIWTPL